jgi:hypothetical protein
MRAQGGGVPDLLPFSEDVFMRLYVSQLQLDVGSRKLRKIRLSRRFGLLLAILFLSGCVYVNIKAPLDRDVNRTELGSKVGTSSSQSVLWLFAWGDAGTEAAARNGGITTITHLDAAYRSYLFGLYSERVTIAYGD